MTLLSGDGAAGKSQLALQLCVASIAGMNWCGLSTAQGPVLFISAEDDVAELHRRLYGIANVWSVDLATLRALRIVPLAGEDAVLAAAEKAELHTTPLFAAIEAAIIRVRPTLIVVDTLADVFAGDENQRAQARQFIGLLRGWAIRHAAAILVLAHPSLSGIASGTGTSGSTGWNNSVRSRLYLERVKGEDGFEPDPDARVLRTVKTNYGRAGGEIRLRWEEGIFATVDSATGASAFGAIAEQGRADQIFLELLTKYEAEGRYVSAFGTANNYAPTAFSRHPQSGGINKRGFLAAMERLFAARRIRVGQSDGPPSKQKKIIVIVKEGSSE